MRVFIVLLCFVAQVVAFAPLLSTRHAVIVGSSATKTLASKKSDAEWSAAILSRENNNRLVVAAGFLSGAASLIPSALADTELEMADLPPPWIPVVFGQGLLVGVGLLTGSLGDVINQESQLDLQSGARAKKEIDRSRSSYFKKK